MDADLGVFALILALMLSLLQAGALFSGRFDKLVPTAATLSALLVFLAFVILIALRIDSDFTVANVAQHSNRAMPLLYKIAGTWGNHEGSMLLFALVLAGFGAALGQRRSSQKCRNADAGSALLTSASLYSATAIQALLTAGVLVFILATSNPFARIFPPPPDGQMLNPLLQDMALAMHPPMLYLGYVGFSAVFSLALAGLLTNSIDRAWGERVHPWIMVSWATLTLGIALGSWWAYRELGWGGFWFWDPVENASLLPWLAGTALLHSNIVLKKRGLLAGWVALLAILTFGLSLIGTFLVRSGAISSVHSFASDPTRGLYILGYIAVAIGAGLWIYGTRIAAITKAAPLRPASREGIIVINNLFLLTACATVLLGTLYPLFAEMLTGDRLTVGAPYFNATFLPIMALPLLFAGLAPLLPWKKAAFMRAVLRAWPSWSAAIIVIALVLAVVVADTLRAALGFGLAAFLMFASAQWLAAGKWRVLAHWPVFMAHFGVALMIIAITGVGLWTASSERRASVGESLAIAGYTISYAKEETLTMPNYVATRATLEITSAGKNIATLAPEFRRYGVRGTTTSEAAIYSTVAYDLYAVIGDRDEWGKSALRIYYKPTISFLWLGALLIALGGLLSALLALRLQRRKA